MTPSKMIAGGLSANAVAAITGDIATGISAAGTTQATATALIADHNYLGTAAASSGVILPLGESTKTMFVYNGGANAVNVYPPTGGTINTIAANLPLVIGVGKSAYFDYSTSTVISADVYTPPSSEVVTSIATVGAGTLTAAALAGGVLTRDGAQSATAFSDATAAAVAIVAAIPNAQAGQSVRCTIKNNTDAAMTITAGSGVTLAGQTVVAANSWCEFIIVLTSLTAVAMTGVEAGQNIVLPRTKRVAITVDTSTLSAGDITGADFVILNTSGQATPTLTTRTGALMAADIPNIQIGFSYLLRIVNANSGIATIAAAISGVTLTGTATLATNTWREWDVHYTAANTFVFTQIGTGTNS